MPSFRSGPVTAIIEARPGLVRMLVDLGGPEPERAYALSDVTGPVNVGDRVVVNTTAVELGLGTGGWHVVHWNLDLDSWSGPGRGHIMKARYTSLQYDSGAAEEQHGMLTDASGIDGMPVVVASLHSQVAAIAAVFAAVRPDLRVAYVMTDGAALPLALSDLVDSMRARAWLIGTITCGHAFGGDLEAVSIHSALVAARHVLEADVTIVAMGPGIVGTNSVLGHSGIEQGPILDAVTALGGQPVAAVRASDADPRPRHRGVSHHSITALTVAAHTRSTVGVPIGGHTDQLVAELASAGVTGRHDVRTVVVPDVVAMFDDADLDVRTMGRPAAADRLLFDCGAAAAVVALDLLAR